MSRNWDINIRVFGEDHASGVLHGIGGALGNMLQFAGGTLLAGGIANLAGGISNLAGEAVSSVADFERMGASLEALLAKEIRNATGIEKTVTVGQERLQLTEKEIAQLDKLKVSLNDSILSRDTLNARIQEQKERIRQLTAQYGENGLVVIKERAELAQMENQLAKTGGAIEKYESQISSLEAKNGKLVDVTQQVVESQISMAQALELASPKARELLQWTEQLAILSPFNSQDIAASLKIGMAYGFTSDQSKLLTENLVDVAAAMGMEGHEVKDLALVIGQINKSDKLLMQDMRQLTMRGIDVEGVLKKMGFSLSDVGEKAIDSKKFVSLLMESWKEDFGGTAERMADSLPGLLSSLDEIKDLALRDVFGGMIQSAKPILKGVVGMFTAPEFRVQLQNFGAMLGTGLMQGIAFVQSNVLPVLGLLLMWFQSQGIPALQSFAQFAGPILVAGLATAIAFLQGQALPALLQFGGWLQAVVLPVLLQFGGFLNQHVLPALAQLAAWLGPVIGTAIQQLGGWITTVLLPALGGMINQIATAALPTLQMFGGWINSTLLPGIQQLAAFLGPLLQQALAALGNIIVTIVLPALTQLIVWILGQGLPALGDLLNRVGGFVNGLLPTFASLWQQVQDNFKKAVKFAQDLGGKLNDLAGVINTAIGPVAKWFNETILQPLLQTLSGLIGAAQSFFYWLGQIADRLAGIQLPDFLQRHSPSPLEQALMNSNAYLREMSGLLPKSLGRLNKENLQRKVNEFLAPAQDSLQISAGAPIAAGGASAGSGVTFDQRRVFEISGPITIYADDPNSFAEALEALGAKVYGELSFAG